MRRRNALRIALLAPLLAGSWASPPAFAERSAREKAELRLASDRSAYAPGESVRLAAWVTVEPTWHVQAHRPTFDYLIPTVLELALPAGFSPARLTYPEPDLHEFPYAEKPLAVYGDEFRILAETAVPADAVAGEVTLTARLTYQACDDRQCLPPTVANAEVKLTIGSGGAPAHLADFDGSPKRGGKGAKPIAAAAGASLWAMLLAGLAGGLILNAMPCVLPILSLKLFGLVKAAGQSRRAVAGAGLATAAGILVSFWGLAAAAIGARAAGNAVGWGIQFQEPGFVAFLAAVVILFSLNLWGLFEVPLPRFLSRVGDAGGESGAGHFVSGLFATLMATPCSAPFLGTALSFALAQPWGTVMAIFTAVGTGMALPYLALAVAPGSARFLPRPGLWMDTLKGFMGFLLAGAAAWLFYVLAAQLAPERLLLVQLALLALGLCAWLRHRAEPGSRRARLAAVGMLAAFLASVNLALTAEPIERGVAAPGAASAPAPGQIAWQPFDRQAAEGLAREGRLVFVDVTADWCLTCKVNERLVLNTAPVAAAFERHGVLPMKADWTNRDAEIGAFLAEHGRYGIPFYLLYRPNRPPHLFGELLTQDAVIRVVEESAAAAGR